MPSGSISEMREGILKAIVRCYQESLCASACYTYPHNLRKDLMQDLHTDLCIMINRTGIKKEIRTILRVLSEYHTTSLLELEN